MEDANFQLHDVLEDQHWWFVSRAEIVHQILLKILGDNFVSPIVDIGCGTGGMVNYLTPHFNCVGIDISKIGIDKGQEEISK